MNTELLQQLKLIIDQGMAEKSKIELLRLLALAIHQAVEELQDDDIPEWQALSEHYDLKANAKDVYYCYRLLLSRNPDPAGWQMHQKFIADTNMSVNNLVLQFLSSQEFRSRDIKTSYSFQEGRYTLVDLEEFEMYVPTDDWSVGSTIISQKVYEPHLTSLLRKTLRPGMVFVDIGANLGYFTLLAAKIVGNTGHVFAFEPSEYNYKYLLYNTKLNNFDNVDIYPFPVAEKKGWFEYISHGSNGDILEVNSTTIEDVASKVLVRSTTIDDVLGHIQQLDVIKIDIEGGEYRAFMGAKKTIAQNRPIIFSEFSPPMLKNNSNVPAKQYLKWLIDQNYHISVIDGVDQATQCRDDPGKVINCFKKRQSTHIDIVAYPM